MSKEFEFFHFLSRRLNLIHSEYKHSQVLRLVPNSVDRLGLHGAFPPVFEGQATIVLPDGVFVVDLDDAIDRVLNLISLFFEVHWVVAIDVLDQQV